MKRPPTGHHRPVLKLLIALLGCCLLLVAEATDRDRSLQKAADGHRPLRENVAEGTAEGAPAATTAPLTFQGFPEAPEFDVVSRTPELTLYPCANCHQHLPVNPEPRTLVAPHTASLEHGGGRFWCLQCHAQDDRNKLQLMSGETVDFDSSWQLCGQCHYAPQQDWVHGAHGKRVGNWRGDRTLYACTHCHDPHAPAITPRAPEPPPPLRRGLAPMNTAVRHGSQGPPAASDRPEGGAATTLEGSP